MDTVAQRLALSVWSLDVLPMLWTIESFWGQDTPENNMSELI